MCGIVGCLGELREEELRPGLEKMTAALRHRGPDAQGLAFTPTPNGTLGFGHRRLAILDLTSTGAQPMLSASGRFLLTFNGEIYNHQRLRAELVPLGHAFRGQSDTETLLAAMEQWGVAGTLERIAGMFAFAAWDKQERRLSLARDRLGEKPLYYGHLGRHFAFASEIKALLPHPAFMGHVNRSALELFLSLGYIPAPLSIYEGILKLPPGHWLELGADGIPGEPRPYWNLAKVALAQRSRELAPADAESAVESVLLEVLKEQRVADVPLGCFLSGGIDSSLVAALLARDLGQPPETFSLGFDEGGFDESAFAHRVADSLGCKHTELRVSAADALALVPELPHIYDEPFADTSQIPTHLLARQARAHVTVALTGDGGDEVFAGYNRYLFLERARSLPGLATLALRGFAALSGAPAFRQFERMLRMPQLDEKLRKAAVVAASGSEAEAYWELATQGVHPSRAFAPVEDKAQGWSGIPGLQLRDQLLYLPDDVLVKVDRAAMAASLETRAPFLDHRVVEVAWRLPLALRVDRGLGKVTLRKLLRRRVPAELWERPKAGFSPPLGAWLAGPLRPWAEELLSERALRETGLPGAETVRAAWAVQKKSTGNSAFRLWPALMAQAWLLQKK